MTTTASDVALHGRHLSEVSASTEGELYAAIMDSSINKILLAAGTYELTSYMMCDQSCFCINRTLTIEAEQPRSVVLNAGGGGDKRIFFIQSTGTVELIGLNITGGGSTSQSTFFAVQSARL